MNVNLVPEHVEDLRKSGLTDETIQAAGIKTIPPENIKKELGFQPPYIVSMYVIPYFNSGGIETGFRRYRCFYSAGQDGRKYLQKKGSGNHLYFPQGACSTLKDPAMPLYITEGEKKALKAFQEGLLCIALSGLWAWKVKGQEKLIQDFDLIPLKGRDLFIVPDNDWRSPNKHGYEKNLEQAVYRLADRLREETTND